MRLWLSGSSAERPSDRRRRAAIQPSHDGVNLRLAERTIVIEMPVLGFSEPRRHPSGDDGSPDGLGPRARALIIEKRKGPICPGRWQIWQCSWTIGSTSLIKRRRLAACRIRIRGARRFSSPGGKRQPRIVTLSRKISVRHPPPPEAPPDVLITVRKPWRSIKRQAMKDLGAPRASRNAVEVRAQIFLDTPGTGAYF